MRPFDPRLLKEARAARGFLAAGVLLAAIQTIAIVATCWSLATLISQLVGGAPDEVTQSGELTPLGPAPFGLTQFELTQWLALLVTAVVLRAATSWGWQLSGLAGAAAMKRELRDRTLTALRALGPDRLGVDSSAKLMTTLGPGLDSLDGYFARYLPQLLLTAITVPLCLATVWLADPLSGLAITLTLPLIPVFMVLIGFATRSVQRDQWLALGELSRAFLELVGGLKTLTIYGRQHGQEGRIRALTDEYRNRTMRVLRVAFLSGFVLEVAASLGIAIVAVSVGLRLVTGELTLGAGLLVLLLTPEIFLPIRAVGAQFHASAEGVTALQDVFALLDRARPHTEPMRHEQAKPPATAVGSHEIGDTSHSLILRNLSVRRDEDLVVDGVNLTASSGELVAVAGPSGSGKSTIIAALLGFVPYQGEISLNGQLSDSGIRESTAWAGQRPGLIAGSVASNIVLAGPADAHGVAEALRTACADEIDPATVLGVGGSGLSGGEAQRVAIARALYRARTHDCPVLILDEPTAALDAQLETRLIRSLRTVATLENRIILVVSHRPTMLLAADATVQLRSRRNTCNTGNTIQDKTDTKLHTDATSPSRLTATSGAGELAGRQ